MLSFGTIKKYDRICQFRFVPKMPHVNFNELTLADISNNTSRGQFGSTGTDSYE